jgi:hypothetical protein
MEGRILVTASLGFDCVAVDTDNGPVLYPSPPALGPEGQKRIVPNVLWRLSEGHKIAFFMVMEESSDTGTGLGET